ncbi:MAG: hypothetical protein NTW14_03435 [bacterium]|nr:hypothetical protein [bacterium]
MEDTALSINKIPVRLTSERWLHIVENHDDMAGFFVDVLETIENPQWIFEGFEGELWAMKRVTKSKVLLVIYRKSKEDGDGFVITAFFTTKIRKLFNRRVLWQQPL